MRGVFDSDPARFAGTGPGGLGGHGRWRDFGLGQAKSRLQAVALGLHRHDLGAGELEALVGLAQAKQVLSAVVAGEAPG
jgi:hypothetical protein